LKEHQQFEIFTDKWLNSYLETGKQICCRDNCSGCCHLAVHATFPEAVAVASELSTQQAADLAAYVERIKKAHKDWSNLKNYLKVHRRELGPCPFLNQQDSCSIYSLRPLACRALLSTRPAAWCTVDFSELDSWDKQAYESSLDRQVVAWPTHYVAETQDFGQKLEKTLLESMHREKGWALSGNFAIMVWLEQRCHASEVTSKEEFHELLVTNGLSNNLLLNFTTHNQSLSGAD
jgi:Fe-S-cluster containining protein